MNKTHDLAIKIRELVEQGYEYPEAEWQVIKDLKNPPSGEALVRAYEELEDEADSIHR